MSRFLFPWRHRFSRTWAAVAVRDHVPTEPGTALVTAVCVRPSTVAGGKPLVLGHVALRGEIGLALRSIKRDLALHRFQVTSTLDRVHYQGLVVDKPAVQDKELDASLRLVLATQVDLDMRESNLVWLTMPARTSGSSGMLQLLVIVAQRRAVESQRRLFADSGIALRALDVRVTAQHNLARLMARGGHTICLVVAEVDGVQVTVSDAQGCYLAMFVAESVLGPDEEALLNSGALDRLALEIQRSLDFLRRNYGHLRLNVVHVAPTETGVDLVTPLSDRLAESVRWVDLSLYFEWPDGSDAVNPAVQARYVHVLGSALRGVLGEGT